MSKLFGRISGLVLVALVVSCLAASPVEANQIGEAGGGKSWSGKRLVKAYEKPCKMKFKKKPAKRKKCNGASKVRMHVSQAKRPSRRMIAKYGDVTSSSGVTLREAYQRRGGQPVRFRTFWQSGITSWGVEELYDERHEGMAFFNGEDVWIAPNHGVEDSGYHR